MACAVTPWKPTGRWPPPFWPNGAFTGCEDFGEIVFNMIAHHCEGQSDTDHRDDFKRGYTFDEAFRKPFLPSSRLGAAPKPVKV